MATVESSYEGQLRTLCIHNRSGNRLITDAPVDNHGKGEAFSPTDLVAASLISCMLTVMGIRAEKMSISLDGATGSVVKKMVSGPRRIASLAIVLEIPGKDWREKDRTILERAAIDCPVALSLHPDLKQEVEFRYF